MSRRVTRVLPLLLLATTACGDATITASSRFPREGDANRGATVHVETGSPAPTADQPGHR